MSDSTRTMQAKQRTKLRKSQRQIKRAGQGR